MAASYERKKRSGPLTLKLYRGEGVALLAFDLDEEAATDDFVGFSVEVKYPGAKKFGPLRNRLNFDYEPDGPRSFPSTEAPFQKFRWVHVPRDIPEGEFEYRVRACYMQPDGTLRIEAEVTSSISLQPESIDGFLNVGFTRGFASSQAYVDNFQNADGILPVPGLKSSANLDHDMAPFEKHYSWLGFEARRLVLEVLQDVMDDESLTLDALIYECKEPDIVRRLEAIGPRLRAVVDDHGEHGEDDSCESLSAARLEAAGAQVRRTHFWRQQHNKVLIVSRNGVPERVVAGSTNFSLRGLYIQANNVLVFTARRAAEKFAELFEAYWDDPKGFRAHALSQTWWPLRERADSHVSVCFSPHEEAAISLDPVAEAIENADSSVLYSVVFLSQISGRVRDALDELMLRSLFSYGVAQRVSGLTVEKPDGSRALLPFAYLADNAPEPFKSEWHGNTTGHSNMVHHKFVVTDFNGDNPCVYTGSSNLAQGGERENGDHLICIRDRKVAIAYAIEALRLFDHFHFRVKAKKQRVGPLRLAKPPAPGKKPWFAAYYRKGHIKERDRLLFIR